MPCTDSVTSAGLGRNQIQPNDAADGQAQPAQAQAQASDNQPLLPFSRSQLSLALTIQKSKPEGVTTRDYCLQLRKHIQQGSPTVEADHRSIDTCAFWKEQCSRLHCENKALEIRVAQLESIGRHGDGNTGTHEEPATFKHPGILQPAGLDDLLSDEPSMVSPDLGHPRTLALLKQSLVLHQMLRDSAVSTEVLLCAIQSCLVQMKSAVSDVCKIIELDRNIAAADKLIVRPLNTITAIFNICLRGLTHLCRDIKGRRHKGQAIYSMVHFFKANIQHLDLLCMSEATRRPSSISNDDPPSMSAHFRAHNQPRPIFIYTKFLASLLRSLEFQKTHLSNIEVLEGMYAILLDDLGHLVSQIVFREHIPSSKKPGRIGEASKGICSPEMLHSLELAGRYLVTVLTSAMECNSGEERHSLTAILAGPKFSGMDADKAQLLTRARRRLQETLVRGIFGQDVGEWKNSLKAPEFQDGWDANPFMVPPTDEGTFMESVWSAVGWDLVLSN